MASQADAVIAALEQAIHQARNDTAVEIVANLMEPSDEGGTPVDTGWARANWIPSIGTPHDGTVGTPGDGASAAGEQQAAIAAVAGSRADGDAWVTNSVDYIQQLNDGSSRKAPAGFVEAAVAKAEQTMQQLHDGKQIDVTVLGGQTGK